MDNIGFSDKVDASCVRARGLESAIKPQGFYKVECRDANGNLKWTEHFSNMVTDQGINNLLDVMFGSVAKSSWFMGLIDNAGGVTLAAGDTHGTHAGWTEATGYSSSTRPAWTVPAASSKQVANASPLSFTMSGSATINGIFVANVSTKGSTSAAGILWSTASFVSPQAVLTSDVLNLTYTVQGA